MAQKTKSSKVKPEGAAKKEKSPEEAAAAKAQREGPSAAAKAARPSAPEEPEGEEEGEEAEARAGEGGEVEKAPKPKGKAKAAVKRGEEEEEEEEEAPKTSYRRRPELSPELARALELRKAKDAHRPEFHRQEWFRYQRLGDKWRKPQGIQSKMRRHWRTHPEVVSIGHRGPKAARGLHPSGYREVLVCNLDGLAKVDPKKEAIRIASSVGKRKRAAIQKKARTLGIRVLNWRSH